MSRMRVFDDTGLGPTRGTEFTEQVRLGDIGEIMASKDIALEARVYDHWTEQPLPLTEAMAWMGDSPLFRAKALERYRDGRWESTRMRGGRVPPAAPMRRDLLRVDIQMKAMVSRALFTLGRTVTCDAASEAVSIERRGLTDEYSRTDDGPLEAFRYSVFVERDSSPSQPGPKGGWTAALQRFRDAGRTEYEPQLLQFPPTLKTAAQLAEEALRDAPTDATAETRARILESYLRDGGRYTYSAKLGVTDPAIDPLEDFLANRKSGHCEYFASALVMMLRSAGIPARLVTGYEGGDWDQRTGVYVVQQLHAHAWVEAQVERGWITLDATPADRDREISESAAQSASLIENLKEAFTSIWSNGVTMNGLQQREMIYLPIVDFAKSAWERLKDIRGTTQAFWGFLVDVIRNPEEWMNWKGGLTVFTLLTALVLIVRSLIRLMARFRSWSRSSDAAAEERHIVEFYEVFRDVTSRAGMTPEPAQTAAEFSQSVSDRWKARLEPAGLGAFPKVLAEEFYRVRFGDQSLTAAEADTLRTQLEHYEACLLRPAAENSPGHDLRSR
jgi:transglutaminase-like putative cysteine protease